MTTSLTQLFFVGLLFSVIQAIAALPWLFTLAPKGFRRWSKDPTIVGYFLGLVLGFAALVAWIMSTSRVENKLADYGRFYGSLLHIQLAIDLLILLPRGLLLVWPKGGAVALSAFRECWRQPMFWLISVLATFAIMVSMVVPYFTFGEDYKMMKQLGFDVTMLAAALFGLLAASISINEEIEGRTAITVISKPINRRQFIMGKYVGTLLACWAMMMLLGWVLTWCLHIKPMFDKLDDVNDTMPNEIVQLLTPKMRGIVPTVEGSAFAHGAGEWFGETFAHHVGLLLTFGQVMVLLAICVALATRMQFVVNLVICFFIFLIGHLAPILVQVTSRLSTEEGLSALKLVGFIAQLFNILFPALEYFEMGSAIVRDSPIPMLDFVGYVGVVFGYAVLYSAIGLTLALILFEDRDLA